MSDGTKNDYWSSVNPTYEEIYGVDLGREAPGEYWPRHRDFEKSDIPEQILVKQDYEQYASVAPGSLKTTTKNIIPFEQLDFFDVLLKHIEQLEHFKAWAFTIRDMRSLFMNKEVLQAIKQYQGKDIVPKIVDYINDFARGGVAASQRNRLLDNLRGNVSVAVLGLKPGIAIKQPTALVAFMATMPTTDFFTGIADYLTNPIGNYKTLYEKIIWIKSKV